MDQYYEFNLWQKLLLRIIWFIEKKIYKRDWNFCEQVNYARIWIADDYQWLGHDETARAICRRHLVFVSDEWYSTGRTDTSAFRNNLGLNPHTK